MELRPSGSDTAYLLAPVLSLLALMILPKGPPATVPGKRAPPDMDGTTQSSPIVVVLDSLVFVVSMFLIAWMALLRRIADSGISGLPLAIALGFPLCGTLVVVTIPLIMVFRRPQNGRAVAVLTAGLLVLAGSASVIVHLTVSGALSADRLALYWLGMVAAPPLIAAAMLVPQQRVKHRRERPGADDLAVWLHAYLPYLPSLIAAVLVVVPAARRDDLDGTTVLLAITLAALVVIRQMITVGQNARLLVKVRAAHRRLHYQALHDPLTGLANRALFTTELTEAVEEHHSHQLSVVTLFCDLDEFKAVNDALGHAAGDELLRAVAMRLRTAVRDDDLVARIGGDEFAVLIRDARRNARAIGEDTAGRIAGAMRPAFSLHGVPRHVRASVGVAVADSSVSGVTAEELMHRADMAMYEAKCHEQQTRAAHRLPSPFSWLQRWRQSVETSRPPGQKLQHDPDGRDVTARRR
ncbi:diguanylate cyclase [Frankia sp. R43]|uniref:diguanylate cyclase n=1 Tax=Frankia sp. R43 TaxID=269536 RepID=UPI001F2F45C7|nr:diguanylate cyclase [Frankia sp. R43]